MHACNAAVSMCSRPWQVIFAVQVKIRWRPSPCMQPPRHVAWHPSGMHMAARKLLHTCSSKCQEAH
jgi:hypothetical protein